ncbi:phosphatase PAP2 family protein [Luteolibacter sp. LG18]|uniref:phosphatase PAP2 family protein n=1 Tax=Luteolibacter sp. LG18 TaxID=2819286 RepID=UPI002B292E74|nr:hypothetical protein llg_15060 [Luteolibacter sp. LG18]
MEPAEPEIAATAVPFPGPFVSARPAVRRKPRLRFWRDVRSELGGLKRAWRRGHLKLWALVGLIVSALLVWQVDGPWLTAITTHLRTCPPKQALAEIGFCRWVNVAGDFGFTALIFVVLAAIHSVHRTAFLRKLVVSVLVSALVVGAVGRVIKFTVGRARPREMVRQNLQPWSCVGPSFSSNYNSFPSGHSSFAAAGTTPVLMAVPWAGVPLTVCSLVIGGSRAVGTYHYPSDVVAGLWLGAMVGGASGLRLRRMAKRAQRIAAFRVG